MKQYAVRGFHSLSPILVGDFDTFDEAKDKMLSWFEPLKNAYSLIAENIPGGFLYKVVGYNGWSRIRFYITKSN